MTPPSAGTTAGATMGLGVLSSVISGFGRIQAGQEQQDAYNYNADIIQQNTTSKVVSNQQNFSALVGRQATAYAGAGVDISSGSPLLIMAATAARGGQQGEQIEQAGSEESAMERYYGKVAAFSGTMSGIGAFLNGVSTAATGYSKATATPNIPYSSSSPDSPGYH